jgi:HEAT repeat protein
MIACALWAPFASMGADEVVRGKSIGTWLRVLRDRHSPEQDLALLALSEVGPTDPRIAPALASVAADPEIGIYAVRALGQFGPSAGEAAPVLNAIISQRPDGPERIAAAEALWKIAKQPECIDALIQSLDDREKIYRAEAASVLGRIGPPAKRATSKLLRLLNDHGSVRIAAVEAFGQIRSDPHATVPELVKALSDPMILVRSNAAAALASFGGDASTAIAALERAATDEDAMVRVETANALWRIGKRPDALSLLFSALVDFDLKTELAAGIALRRLAEIGRENKEVAPRLLELVNQGHPHKVEIAMALWELNRRSETLAALTAALEDEHIQIRLLAVEAIGELGPEAKDAAPALLKALARTPDQERLVSDDEFDDPPIIAAYAPNTRLLFQRFQSAAWKALQKIDPDAAAQFRSQKAEAIPSR